MGRKEGGANARRREDGERVSEGRGREEGTTPVHRVGREGGGREGGTDGGMGGDQREREGGREGGREDEQTYKSQDRCRTVPILLGRQYLHLTHLRQNSNSLRPLHS